MFREPEIKKKACNFHVQALIFCSRLFFPEIYLGFPFIIKITIIVIIHTQCEFISRKKLTFKFFFIILEKTSKP